MDERSKKAKTLFEAGKFNEAREIYAHVLEDDPENYQGHACSGYISLLNNHLDEAEEHLKKAMTITSRKSFLKELLAEVYYRRDQFQQAASLLKDIGKVTIGQKLASFQGTTPYQLVFGSEISAINFLMTDPLPVISVGINKREPVYFFIDTGGGEVIIDDEYANDLNLPRFGSETGVFAGGKKAHVQHARVSSLALGDVIVNNLPANIMQMRRFSPIFGGHQIDGVIGTTFLYHFLATLDYTRGKLVLQEKTGQNLTRLKETTLGKNGTVIPFWMVGDHFMVAWGTVNKSEPMLFFMDTGLAGLGFTCPRSTLKNTRIQRNKRLVFKEHGGGGKVNTVPFTLDELSLGGFKAREIHGVFGPFPSFLENGFGFHIGGLISHAFFRNCSLTLDFTEMNCYLTKS